VLDTHRDTYCDSEGNTMSAPGTLAQPDRTAELPKKRTAARSSGLGRRIGEPFVIAGEMWQLMVRVLWMAVRKPIGYWGEVRDQSYDVLKLTWLPVTLAAFGFGFGAPGLTGGAIFYVFGAPYRLGAFFEFASVREFAPFINGMVIAGVVGTAITADLGARRIRDEIDAMEVLGVDPVRTLVLPRVLALVIMTTILNIMALVVGLVSGWVAAVYVFDASSAAYYGSLFDLLNITDLWGSMVKSAIYGMVIGIVCTYIGMNAKGGPMGVGRAVNTAVVIAFAGIWIVNFVFTLTLLGLNPDIHVYK
jgi:phospholipid/cholesterol/gamma-HCH transport system permease protein